ncbi:MAG: hypothetical protein O7E52_04655, partial [Candidatus Poribacteria bacterium]|nr:hypothetical protein [Candidatus Poribacteria bacterium]
EPVQSQGGFDPPALQGDVDDRPGRLTAALLWVLQNPEPTTAAFWNALSAALAEQGLTVPESLRTLAVEDSLFAEIQGTEPILDRRIRLIFNHQEKTLVIQRQE